MFEFVNELTLHESEPDLNFIESFTRIKRVKFVWICWFSTIKKLKYRKHADLILNILTKPQEIISIYVRRLAFFVENFTEFAGVSILEIMNDELI